MSAHPDPSSTARALPAPASDQPLLQNVEKCYNSAAEPRLVEAPEFPETPFAPDDKLTSQQLLKRHTKPLSPQQLTAIDLLITGRSDARTAAAIDVARVTVTRWRLYNHVFQAELNRRRHEVWGAAADRLRATLSKAVRLFQSQLRSKDEFTAFRAARALLQIAGSSRLALPPHPDAAPPDPAGVLDLEARRVKVELASVDPHTDPIYDEDRALALRRMLHKNQTDPRPAAEHEEEQP
jgi:hypothetical protein